MVSFDITSLHKNITLIDTLNPIENYLKSDDLFIRKTAIPQDKFLDLGNLVLTTTWNTFNSYFYHKSDGRTSILKQIAASKQIFICRLMSKLKHLRHYTLYKFGNDFLIMFIPLLNVCCW